MPVSRKKSIDAGALVDDLLFGARSVVICWAKPVEYFGGPADGLEVNSQKSEAIELVGFFITSRAGPKSKFSSLLGSGRWQRPYGARKFPYEPPVSVKQINHDNARCVKRSPIKNRAKRND